MATQVFYSSGTSVGSRFFVKDESRELSVRGLNFIIGSSHCNTASPAQPSSILGGFCSCVNALNSSVLYGICNFATSTFSAANSSTVGGKLNRVENSDSAAVLAGCDNRTYGNCNVLLGGHSNLLGSFTAARLVNASFLGGGGFNRITGVTSGCVSTVEYSLIVGGYANTITTCYASILGGRQNLVSDFGATVIGDGGSRDKISRGACSLSLDFNGGIFLTGSNITLSPSPLPGSVDFCNSNLINSTPNILNVNTNFSIGAGYNSRVVLANSGSILTGTINLGNPTGFNASIIQIGAGQVQITGSVGVRINSFNNQFKTAGQFATISLLHSGNNGYLIYGDTAL